MPPRYPDINEDASNAHAGVVEIENAMRSAKNFLFIVFLEKDIIEFFLILSVQKKLYKVMPKGAFWVLMADRLPVD
jgi:hypothetical protein